jgi:hypothetical protein
MLRSIRFPLALLLTGFLATAVLALGADHPKSELEKHGPNCIHGFFVNWVDVFFFAGDGAACTKFVADLAKDKNVLVRVVLHPGSKKARSPWDKEDRDLPTDWTLTTGDEREQRVAGDDRKLVRVDVWVGSKIKLADLRLPAEAEVVSSGEIEKFIAEHQKQKK